MEWQQIDSKFSNITLENKKKQIDSQKVYRENKREGKMYSGNNFLFIKSKFEVISKKRRTMITFFFIFQF